MSVSRFMAGLLLVVHLGWILWVILGCLFTRNRTALRWLHVLSLIYGVFIETGHAPCPLTIAEQWFQMRAGDDPYEGGFLIHYLEALVYPDVPPLLLMVCAVSVCLFNLGVYAYRYRRRGRTAGW